MKKTMCKICGKDAVPIYIRIKIDGEEKKGLQFVRTGTWCMNPDCYVIDTDEGLYRNESNNPDIIAGCKKNREKAEREELMEVMIEVLQEPKFIKKLGLVPLPKKKK